MLDPWINNRCWSNYQLIKGRIRAVTLIFNGLGGAVVNTWTPLELALAEENILTILPYYGPWSWMNRSSRAFVDDLVERVYSVLQLGDDVPLIASGVSMGGCASLLYSRYGKRPVAGCDALYPVTDLIYHFDERHDVAVSMSRAFYGYAEPWEEVLREHSPLYQVEHMPRIPYLIIHGLNDKCVNIYHSDAMAEAMRKRSLQLEYIRDPQLGHGCNIPLRVWQKRIEFILSLLQKQ